ncbi:MAG: sensor histidine kinase [Chloroflexi bacterium]|nr:sensor histidine kinase [Chloroflexota bacterium]
MAPLAAKRGIAVSTDADSCSSFVLADRQRLKQILLNFLSNAVKYNREGGAVTISCSRSRPDRLRIAVTDTGAGIPEDKLHRSGRRSTGWERSRATSKEAASASPSPGAWPRQ